MRRASPDEGGLPYTVGAGLDDEERAIVAACHGYTLVSIERLVAVIDAVRHIARRGIPGALVECGVWRGGSVLAMLLALQGLGAEDRDVYLYDTFEGMTKPTSADTSRYNESALNIWQRAEAAGGVIFDYWFRPDLTNQTKVEELLRSTGYPAGRLHFVAGRVEDTLPSTAPDEIALLRLDTDWYESTRHELVHLYPRLRPGGVLLVDDYGHWDGARRAVDEYFDQCERPPLLARTDYSGRLGVKPE